MARLRAALLLALLALGGAAAQQERRYLLDLLPPEIQALIDPACEREAIFYSFSCGSTAITPLLLKLSGIVNGRCLPPAPGRCGADDVKKILDDLAALKPEMTTLVSSSCDPGGENYECFRDLLGLVKRCIRSDVKSSLPDGINVDEAIDALLLACDRDDKGDSCGLKVFDFLLAQSALAAQGGGFAACQSLSSGDQPSCSAGCSSALEALKSDVGCCWADFTHAATNTDMGGKALPAALAKLSAAWSICGVEEPSKTCAAFSQREEADSESHMSHGNDSDGMPGAWDHPYGPRTGPHGSPSTDAAGGADTTVIIAAAVGGGVGLILVILTIVLVVRRRSRAGNAGVAYAALGEVEEEEAEANRRDDEMLQDGWSTEA